MKITFLVIGKTDEKYLNEGINGYLDRLKHYCKPEFKIIPDIKNVKNLTKEAQKLAEAEQILKNIKPTDFVILLDERGDQKTSPQLAKWFENLSLKSVSSVVMIVGGPYGFDEQIYKRANAQLSFSLFTFSHQMIRLMLVEQVYRAYTIIKGEPYHHV